MDSGFYAACAGLAAQTQALDLVANNLANLSTTGYRGSRATFRTLLSGSGSVGLSPVNAAINAYGTLSGSRIDRSSGSLTPTGNPLDLAIAGDGFFEVQSGGSVLFTRNGSFHRTPEGLLVSAEGDPVLGEQGRINLPNGPIAVSSDGTISVAGAVVAKLRVVEFSPTANLQAAGNALYEAPEKTALPAASSSVRQAMLEQSNVSSIQGIVQLINVQRNAEMMQRALSLFDSQFNQTAVQDLAKV